MRKIATALFILALVGATFAFEKVPLAEVGVKMSGTSSGIVNNFVNREYPALYDSSVLLNFIIWPMYGSPDVYQYLQLVLFGDSTWQNAPWGRFQGYYSVFPTTGLFDSLRASIARHDSTPVKVWLIDSDDDSLYIGFTIDDPMFIGRFIRLFIFILENHISAEGATSPEYNWVVRDVLPHYIGDLIMPSSVGDTLRLAYHYTRSYDWLPWNCELAIVVDTIALTTREVIQAAHAPLPLPSHMFAAKIAGTSSKITDLGNTETLIVYGINYGRYPDTLKLKFSSEAPAGWDIRACTRIGCFDDSQSVFLGTSSADTVWVIFRTNPTQKGTGKGIINLTSVFTDDSFEFNLSVTTGDHVILIDDDVKYEFERYYITALESIGEQFYYYNRNWGPLGYDTLSKFDIAIWFTGHHSQNTLDRDDRAVLRMYLNNGGNLFITGNDIGWDLVLDMRDTDPGFFTNFLHASSRRSELRDSAASHRVFGMPADPIGDALLFSIDDGDGANNARYADVITPVGGAQPILFYGSSTRDCAGLRYKGTYGLVYLAFGYEAIDTFSIRKLLMQRIISWFDTATGIKESEAAKPKELSLSISPNPFNSRCAINYQIPGKANLEILDINGKLVESATVKGFGTYIWDAADKSSGIYIISLCGDGFTHSSKIALIK